MSTHASLQIGLDASYATALNIMKDRAVSFYQAFSMLPEDRFRAVAAVYAFCRTADDIADSIHPEDADSALVRLDRLEALLCKLYKENGSEGLSPAPPWLPAFADSVRRFSLPLAPFLNQLAGQRMDILGHSVRNTEQLLRYARLVAGSVGLMLLPMLAQNQEAAGLPALKQACEELGIAMQITNILRDVGEDLRLRGRLYLPLQLLKEHRLTPQELSALACHKGPDSPPVPQAFIHLWEGLAVLADRFYQGIEPCLCFIHPDCRSPLLAAARSYQAIADAVRAERYDCFTRRCYTSQETRRAILKAAHEQVRQLSC